MKIVAADAKGEIGKNKFPASPPTHPFPLPSPVFPLLSPPYTPLQYLSKEGLGGHVRYINNVTWLRRFHGKISILCQVFFPQFPNSFGLRVTLRWTGVTGLERFSIECRKTKTKVITLANHKGHR